jgi:hypothetical protein
MTKNLALFLAVIFISTAFSSLAFAATNSSRTELKKFPEQSKISPLTTTAQLTTSNYEYKEPGIMKLGGRMDGLLLGFNYRPLSSDTFFQTNLEFYTGTLTYTGALMDGTPLTQDSKDHYYTLQVMGGGTLTAQPGFLFDLMGGLGYRYLNENGASSHSYEREQTYTYLPLQAQGRILLSPTLSVLGGVEFDYLLQGKNTSHLSDVNPNAPDLEFTQDSGTGTRLFVGMTSLVNTLPVHAEIYYRTWAIDRSSKVAIQADNGTYYFVEPENKTTQTGISAGMVF